MSRKVSHFASGWTNPGSAGGGFSFGSGRNGSYGKIGQGTEAIILREEHTTDEADEEDVDANDDADCRRSEEKGRVGAMAGRWADEVDVEGFGAGGGRLPQMAWASKWPGRLELVASSSHAPWVGTPVFKELYFAQTTITRQCASSLEGRTRRARPGSPARSARCRTPLESTLSTKTLPSQVMSIPSATRPLREHRFTSPSPASRPPVFPPPLPRAPKPRPSR